MIYQRDIRELRQSMAAIKAQQEEIIKSRDAVQASERSKTEFLANMSHEIRTPMTAIIGMTEIAEASDDMDKIRYCLRKVSDASEHLLGVINDILDVSKIEAGRFELSYTDFTIERMLMRISDMMAYRIDQKKQNFIIKLDSDVPTAIISDRQRLTQLIMNLLSNANKFTGDGGTIILRIGVLERPSPASMDYTLLFEVTDDGIGIEESSLERIFESFEQENTTISRRFGGTGLGLVIGKTIATQMGGRLWVESEVGIGSTFSFTVCARQGISNAVKRISPNINVDNVNVMVVDDSKLVCDYFVEIAENIGISCFPAADAEETFALLDKIKPDIMFIDFLMPGMDGIELTRQIRRKYGYGVVVIMISGMNNEEIERKALDVGVDKFLMKPLLSSAVIDCINTCLGEQEQTQKKDAAKPVQEALKGKCVLLAEDVAINREIVASMLGDTGIRIVAACDGQEACDFFARDPLAYDLILMDIHMPNVDGYEATRKIREMPYQKAKEIPILALTANAFKEDIEKCLDAGMDDHLGKPFKYNDFIEKIALHIGKANTGK